MGGPGYLPTVREPHWPLRAAVLRNSQGRTALSVIDVSNNEEGEAGTQIRWCVVPVNDLQKLVDGALRGRRATEVSLWLAPASHKQADLGR